MQYKIYEVKAEEKLSAIAEKFATTPEIIKKLNPDMRLTGIWGNYVAMQQGIKVPTQPKSSEEQKAGQASGGDLKYARYRCEQINITKIDGIPRSNSTQNTQFSVELNSIKSTIKIKLEESFFDINPFVLESMLKFIQLTEDIKNDVTLSFNQDGLIQTVLNKQQINERWIKFKLSDQFNTEFINQLRVKDPRSVAQIIALGDKQFDINAKSEEDYQRSLFCMLLFGPHLTSSTLSQFDQFDFLFRSILLPDTIIPLNIERKYQFINSEEKQWIELKTNGIPNLSNNLHDMIVQKYDQYHKPQIKFSFTEYTLNFEIKSNLDSKDRLPLNGELQIVESIRNNIESICLYKIRKIEG